MLSSRALRGENGTAPAGTPATGAVTVATGLLMTGSSRIGEALAAPALDT
ncbi:hypothetical protein [Streptomyces sp. NPDC047939]